MPWTRWRATVSYWWVCPRNSRGAQCVRIQEDLAFLFFPFCMSKMKRFRNSLMFRSWRSMRKCQSVVRLHVASHEIAR
ncbi:hypothetical protein BKA60DRAFT_574773 [Fusarium oxysporum]|nr:hypothetical protein BKA60DRAFT_574773 [Fusarium oxysporum]